MKTWMTIALVFFFSLAVHAQSSEIEIAPFQTARINCPAGPPQEASVGNTAGKGVDVAVLDAVTGQQIRGFGLGPWANAEVSIAEGQVLALTNRSAKKRVLTVSFAPQRPISASSEGQRYIDFTLHNSSLKSIPLVIPGVMNPNLSPLSDSGVGLALGQPIYFRHKGKDILLLQVDETIQNGQRIDVAALIRKRKQERSEG